MNNIEKANKLITIRIPRGKKLPLSPRARFVWARLVRLPFHASTSKLAKWCGELVGRSDGLAVALRELTDLKLVERGPRGWVALQPCGEVAKLFEWPSRLAHLSRWQDKYAYTPVTVPVTYPFGSMPPSTVAQTREQRLLPSVRRENALEAWLVWETLKRLPRDKFPGPSLLAFRLGISRSTARKLVNYITSLEDVFCENGALKCAPGARQTHTVCTDPVQKVLVEVGVPESSHKSLREKADELKLTNTKFIRLVRKAASRHNPDEFGDDPTPIIRSFLKKEATFKAKGRGTRLQKPAGV